MAVKILLRGGLAADWTSANPVLSEREVAIETDTNLMKIGDGTTAWNSLNYVANAVNWGDILGTLSDQTDLQSALNAKENNITAGTTFQYWRGDKSWQTLDKTTIGLNNVDNTSDSTKNSAIATLTNKTLNSPVINTPTGITKSDVGLANVDNTSDINKPVSTLQAAADTTVLNSAKSYADGLVVGMWNDRGTHDASTTLYPSTGGSGIAGAIKKGDIWTISVAGTIGTHVLNVGDSLRALVDSPGTTNSNWASVENNIGYTPENSANKDTDGTLTANSDIKYSSQKAVKTYVDTGLTSKINTSVLDTDGTLSSNSDAKLATQKAVKTYADTKETSITAGTSGQYWRGDKTWQTLDKSAVGLSNVANLDTSTTANITDSTNKRFVTDAQEAKIDYLTVTSGVNLDDINTKVNALDSAIVLKGTWDASSGVFPGSGTAQAGWTYIVSVAGTVDGVSFSINDRVLAIVDNASTGTFASNWFKEDYTDLVSSVDGNTGSVTLGTIINGLTAKTTPVDADTVSLSDSAASNASKKLSWANIKATLKTYFDTLYANITHTHSGTEITTGTIDGDRLPSMSTTKLGGVPATSTPSGKFLKDDGTWATPAGGGGGGITRNNVTGTSQTLVANNAYLANNALLVTFTLPATAAINDIFIINGYGAGGWKIAQNASQQIVWNSGGVDGLDETTVGVAGYLSSTDRYDYIEIECAVANTIFKVNAVKGEINLN